MSKDIKKNEILKMLEVKNYLSVKDIASRFNISDMTARRYLSKLDMEKKLIKTHGGAIRIELHRESPYKIRKENNIESKKIIAKEAIKNIQDNQTLIIDSGSTCYEIAKLLKDKNNLRIITNDIIIASYLFHYHEVYILGGFISKEYCSASFNLQDDFINSINVDLLIMGISAVSKDGILSSPHLERGNIKKKFISRAYHKILLADSSKFMKRGFVEICGLREFDNVYTDENIDKNMYRDFIRQGIKIKICKESQNEI